MGDSWPNEATVFTSFLENLTIASYAMSKVF